jgi:hypothetical protein
MVCFTVFKAIIIFVDELVRTNIHITHIYLMTKLKSSHFPELF